VLIENLGGEFLIPGEDVHVARAEFIQTAASLPFHADILDQVQMVRLADPADFSSRKKALEEGFVVAVPETGGNVAVA